MYAFEILRYYHCQSIPRVSLHKSCIKKRVMLTLKDNVSMACGSLCSINMVISKPAAASIPTMVKGSWKADSKQSTLVMQRQNTTDKTAVRPIQLLLKILVARDSCRHTTLRDTVRDLPNSSEQYANYPKMPLKYRVYTLWLFFL